MATVLGELKHYGVLGMKWGRRKSNPRRVHFQDTETGEISKRKYSAKSSSDHVRSRELKRLRSHKLSNAQIEKVNKRLQLEVTMRSLKQKNSTITVGKKKLATVLAGLGVASSLYSLASSKKAEIGYRTFRAAHPELHLPKYMLPQVNIKIPKL